jgi:hypothetical protein
MNDSDTDKLLEIRDILEEALDDLLRLMDDAEESSDDDDEDEGEETERVAWTFDEAVDDENAPCFDDVAEEIEFAVQLVTELIASGSPEESGESPVEPAESLGEPVEPVKPADSSGEQT